MMNIGEVLDELQQCSSILLNFDLTVKREKMVMRLCELALNHWNCDDWAFYRLTPVLETQ
jgi:hypothetical protein